MKTPEELWIDQEIGRIMDYDDVRHIQADALRHASTLLTGYLLTDAQKLEREANLIEKGSK